MDERKGETGQVNSVCLQHDGFFNSSALEKRSLFRRGGGCRVSPSTLEGLDGKMVGSSLTKLVDVPYHVDDSGAVWIA